MTELAVAVLGPLELRVDGAAVEVPGSKRRAVLALLALAGGRVVSADALIDAVWSEEPPDTARQALQSHISRLRRSLGPSATRLERRGEGYRLELAAEDLDATVARRAARQLSGHETAADPDRRVAAIAAALALFRGAPLTEFAEFPVLAAEAVGLVELRDDLRDLWLETRLAAAETGRPDPDLVVDAGSAAALDPLRERTALVRVAALATAGRTAEAMQAAADYRRRLAEETGLDPGPLLGRLEHEVASGARQPRAAPERKLVRPPTPFFGRERDRDEVHRLLDGYPCVTVTGPGGVGKTRLAVEVAADRGDRGTVPVAWVPLAAVVDPGRVPEAVVGALRLRVERPSYAAVADALIGRDLLLVLDNCEHVLAAGRELVNAIQAAAPGVRVLATSRSSLQVPGEYVMRLQPLPVPLRPGPHELRRQPAVQAFLEYADRRRRGAFVLDAGNAEILVDVLRRLDGLPLAIELAAGQLATLPIEALHERLGRALDALTADRPTEQARHRTLRATIEWSYRLLRPAAQTLLRQLAVFPGGVDLGTVEDLAGELDLAEDPITLLSDLVDGSLLSVDVQGASRYLLLETVRAYLLDELTALGERDQAETRFVIWAHRTVEELAEGLSSADERAADRRLHAELANLSAARALSLRRGDVDLQVTISRSLTEGTLLRDVPEVWNWARELVGDPLLDDHPDRAVILGSAAISSWLLGNGAEAARLAAAVLALGPTDPATACSCHNAMANAALSGGEFETAGEHWERAAEYSNNPGPQLAAAALAAGYRGDPGAAAVLLDRAWAQLLRRPSQSGRAFTAYTAAEIADDPETATRHYTEAIAEARASGARFVEGVALVGLASTLSGRDEIDLAAAIYADLIDYWYRTGNLTQLWTTIRNVAVLLVDAGDLEVAVSLFAAADAAHSASVVAGSPAQRTLTAESQIAQGLDSTRAGAARDRARRLATADVMRLCHEALSGVGVPKPSTPGPT